MGHSPVRRAVDELDGSREGSGIRMVQSGARCLAVGLVFDAAQNIKLQYGNGYEL
jgi:hypothetical protein